MESYRFQDFRGIQRTAFHTQHRGETGQGEYNGIPYTGIVYSATDDTGKVVSPPFKSSRFGKRFGNELLKSGC